MQLAEYKNIFENEATHFYYVANHQIILDLIKRYLPQKRLKILDAGCGTGLLAKKLQIFGDVWGVDINPEAIKLAKKRGVKTKLASVNKLPFHSKAFDLVVSLDVIYHKQVNDDKALAEFYRVLKPGGILILRVPANKWLKSRHDRFVHTRERYSSQELKKKVLKSGFNILKLSFINSLLLPIASITALFEKFGSKSAKSGIKPLPQKINTLLTKLLLLDLLALKKINLPFGIGLVTVVQKPQATKYPLVKRAVKASPKIKKSK